VGPAEWSELKFQAVAKAVALLAVSGIGVLFALMAYSSHRHSNVRTINVSRFSDLDEAFEIGKLSLRVRNPEFLKVCFTGDYVYALKDAQQWFGADEAEFKPALRAAGTQGDTYNDGDHSSIVLISHSSALILQLDRRTELLLANLGCANADAVDIKIKRYETNTSTEFYLPNATLRSPRDAGQPQATACAEKLERFVESIDELLAAYVLEDEPFWAVIRKYVPVTGCNANEVISISKRSKFFERPYEGPISHIITFGNANIYVGFSVEKATGSISFSHVSSRHVSL
jgi:hypothetical protein